MLYTVAVFLEVYAIELNYTPGDSVIPIWSGKGPTRTVISCHWGQPGDCELPIEDAGLKDLRKGLVHIDHISLLKSVLNCSLTFINVSDYCILRLRSDFVGEYGKLHLAW